MHTLNISAIAYQSQRNILFSGSRDYSVKCWDVNNTSSPIAEFSAPRNIVTAMHLDPNQPDLLYQCSEDLSIRVWDIRVNNSANSNKSPAIHITGFVYFPLCVDVHSSRSHLLGCGCKGVDGVGGEVKIFDIRHLQQSSNQSVNTNAKPMTVLTGHKHDVTGCSFSTISNHILSVSKDGTCRAFNWSDADESPAVTASTTKTHETHLMIDSLDKFYTCMSVMSPSQANIESAYVGAIDGSIGKLEFGERSKLNSSTTRSEISDENHNYVLKMNEVAVPYSQNGDQ